MTEAESSQRRLDRLRGWRNRSPRDTTLKFLSEHVKKTVVKPHQQLGKLVEAFIESVPAPLAERTALVSLSRGVLTVHVADNVTLYEMDRLLRGGLEQQLRKACGVTLRKVKCRVGTGVGGSGSNPNP